MDLWLQHGCSFAWIPLREKPGLGTVLNILIIASVLDLSLFLIFPQIMILSVILPHLLESLSLELERHLFTS